MSFYVKIDPDKCKSCQLCIAACPKKIMRLSDEKNSRGFLIAECSNQELCIGCKACAEVCPDVAIEIIKEDES